MIGNLKRGRIRNCRILITMERLFTPRAGHKFAWLLELVITAMVVLTTMPYLSGQADWAQWITDSPIRWITLGLLSFNFITEFLVSPVTYKDKKRPVLNFALNPMNWLEIVSIVTIWIPGAWSALAMMRLFKILYLGNTNVTVLISKHVVVQYGMLLLETLILAFMFLFIGAAGVLAIELNSPGAFNGDIQNIWDAFYFSFIAASTIGFGDISPLIFSAQVYTMLLAIFGIIVMALISAIFVAGFTNGAKTFRKIVAPNRRAQAQIYEMMIRVDGRIRVNRLIDKINIVLTKLHIKPIEKTPVTPLVVDMRRLQRSGVEETKEFNLSEIYNKINIQDKTKDYPTIQDIKQIVHEAMNIKADQMNNSMGIDSPLSAGPVCSVGSAIKHKKVDAYIQEGDKLTEWSIESAAEKGNWVLVVFYPSDFTKSSQKELQDIANNYKDYLDNGIEVLAISNQSKESHRLWANDDLGKVPFALASDPKGFHGKRFGFFDETEGKNRRGLVLIDNNGVIQGINAVGYNVVRTAEQILYFAKTVKESVENNDIHAEE